MLVGQESVGPTGGRNQRHPVGAVLERPDGGRSHFHAPLRRRTGRVVLLLELVGSALVPNHLAPVAVDLEGNDGVVEPLAVVVQEHEGVDESVTQTAVKVKGLVGVGDVNTLVNQLLHQEAGGGGNLVFEHLVDGLSPGIGLGASVAVEEWPAFTSS